MSLDDEWFLNSWLFYSHQDQSNVKERKIRAIKASKTYPNALCMFSFEMTQYNLNYDVFEEEPLNM